MGIERQRKEQRISDNCDIILNNAINAIRENLAKVLKSGAIDIDAYDPSTAPMVLPKSIMAALLEEEADQLDLTHTSYKKEFLADKKNIKLFV